MTIKSTERKFVNSGHTGEKEITRYYLETPEQEKRNPSTFIITESENNTGLPIGDNLIFGAARFLSDYYGLEGRRVTIFAERREGDFHQCTFRWHRPTIGAELQIDFIEGGGAKIEVAREYVENQAAKIESWKQQHNRQVDFNFEEAGLTPLSKFVQNPDTEQPQQKQQKQEQKLKLEF